VFTLNQQEYAAAIAAASSAATAAAGSAAAAHTLFSCGCTGYSINHILYCYFEQ
jgi:hypothetical protein